MCTDKAKQELAEMPERFLVRGAWSLGNQCLVLISLEVFLLCSAMATTPMLTSRPVLQKLFSC